MVLRESRPTSTTNPIILKCQANTKYSYTGLLNNDSLPSAAWTNTNGANFIGFQEGVPSAPIAPVSWSLQTDDVSSWTSEIPKNHTRTTVPIPG